MGGNQQRQKKNYNDPFQAGQMVGMLVILCFLEKNGGISPEALQRLKILTATNVEEFLDRPVEDIFLMVDNMIQDIEQL